MNDLEKKFFEAFEGMSRMAPGSETSTIKVADLLNRRREPLEILDISCGNGSHTMLLTRLFSNAVITTIDNHGPFIDSLNQSVEEQCLSQRVKGQVADMFKQPTIQNSQNRQMAEKNPQLFLWPGVVQYG